METLKIEIPNGFEIDTFDIESGEIKFKAKKKSVLDIKSVDDLLAYNGISIHHFNANNIVCDTDEVAYRILKMVAKSLNEGWEPDWNNDNEPKYVPWFYMGGSSGFRLSGCGDWISVSYVGSRLCFKRKDLAEHAVKYFLNVYKDYMLK